MERHDMTMRAARYLLGAGMIAVAMVAATAQPAAAETCAQFSEGGVYPAICGFVFADTDQVNGDNKYELGEGVGNVTVFVTTPDGTPVNSSDVQQCGVGLDPCGSFTFGDWPSSGPYLFCIVDATHTEQDCSKRTDSFPVNVTLGPEGYYTEIELVPPTAQSGPGTGTPGYWKTHASVWPSQIEVGGVTYFKNPVPPQVSQSVAIGYMGKVSGDKTLSMFAALIAAKLNLWNQTNPICIQDTVDDANAWLTMWPVGSPIKGSNPVWSADTEDSGSSLHQKLDDYNNGRLCAPHRD